MSALNEWKNPILITDFYELTMAAAYFENNMHMEGTFDLFARRVPPKRNYMVLGGIERILSYLSNLHFTPPEIDYLRGQEVFQNVRDEFFDYLKTFKFTGQAWMMREGTIFFEEEPVIRITAPIIEAQIIETYLLTVINLESSVASKAARVVEAARQGGRAVVDFGSRRAHGPEAAVRAARACYLAGCAATSNVYAGFLYGIPVSGTSAHSWTMAHQSEKQSFEDYYRIFPKSTVLLIDTYDTIEGAKIASEMGAGIVGVRIDSGDIIALSKKVRRILDKAGLKNVKVIASGDLDEYEISRLLEKGAPIDMFGVGTRMVTSEDAPYLTVVYKLVEICRNGKVEGTVKFSEHKVTWPFKKQVWRSRNADRLYDGDFISMADEDLPDSEPLLKKMMEGGRILVANPPLNEIREWVRYQLDHMPELHRRLLDPMPYPVNHTKRQKEALDKLREEHLKKR